MRGPCVWWLFGRMLSTCFPVLSYQGDKVSANPEGATDSEDLGEDHIRNLVYDSGGQDLFKLKC